ncbi:response regulator transcription factor [Streptomyces sp. CA-132043]|uniref:response regulator transcription factor n=1 Tax=Streptomyces sp. CA-132043 TaxID=3240048 RepID=UPI003D8E9891
MIQVTVAHDVDLFRSALVALLRAEPSFEVTAVPCRNWHRQAVALRSDVAVLDCQSSGAAAALEAFGRFRPHARRVGELLVLVPTGRPRLLLKACDAGARAFVDRDGDVGTLVKAIRTLAEGESFVDDSLALDFLRAKDMPLSAREVTVLSLIADGQATSDIARILNLSIGTVRNYLAAATRKVNARNRMDAIRLCRQHGWI